MAANRLKIGKKLEIENQEENQNQPLESIEQKEITRLNDLILQLQQENLEFKQLLKDQEKKSKKLIKLEQMKNEKLDRDYKDLQKKFHFVQEEKIQIETKYQAIMDQVKPMLNDKNPETRKLLQQCLLSRLLKFCKDAVDLLLLGSDPNYQLGCFWMLHFVLNLQMVRMDPDQLQKLVITCLYAMGGLVCDTEHLGKQKDPENRKNVLNWNKNKKTAAIYPFSKNFMKQYVVHCAKMLQLIDKLDEVSLYALGSIPCENTFSEIRSLCKYNQNLDMTVTAIKRMKVCEIADATLKEHQQDFRMAEHLTQVISKPHYEKFPNQKTYWKISEAMVRCILDKEHTCQADRDLDQMSISKFWRQISNSITNEHYRNWKDRQTVQVIQVPNSVQPGPDSRIKQEKLKIYDVLDFDLVDLE